MEPSPSNTAPTSSSTSQSNQKNVQFYRNLICSRPKGALITDIHQKWWDNFILLEAHHGYIQWLFPNAFKSRFNPDSVALSLEEAEIFRTDFNIAKRYLKSYQMMLRFYGMKLKSKLTGDLGFTRSPPYKQRLQRSLISSWHNHMRITRILASLSLCGFGLYAKKLAEFILEQVKNGELKQINRSTEIHNWLQFLSKRQYEGEQSIYFKQNTVETNQECNMNDKE